MALHLIPRLFVTKDLAFEQSITLSNEQEHYILRVMRLGIGDDLRIFNGRDGEWLGTINSIEKKAVHVNVKEQLRIQQQEPELSLYCAPIKKAHFEYMIEKATELGVSAIHPILTARTQIREVNTDRCHTIALEAAEQSERLTIPSISKAITLKKCLEEWPKNYTPIICAEWGDAISMYEVFTNLPKLGKTGIYVGPEGGFTSDEFELLRALPYAHFIRLGSRILRADTAAIAALSCWQAICGDWSNEFNSYRSTLS